MLIGAPSWEMVNTLLFQLLLTTPPLLEIAAFTLLIHGLIRNSGTAYAVSMMVGFIAIVNHEVNLIAYPPGQIGIPAHISLSSITQWQPWLEFLLTIDMLKINLVGLLAALAWAIWPRSSDLSFSLRLTKMSYRLRQKAGVLALGSLFFLGFANILLYDKLVLTGDYQTLSTQNQTDAEWEKYWWDKASEFTVAGGDVKIKLVPNHRSVEVIWKIYGVKATPDILHGDLPHGLTIKSVTVNKGRVEPEVKYDHFIVPLEKCASQGCDLVFHFELMREDWPDHDQQTWIHPSGVWLRAKDILPSLGLHRYRPLKDPAERSLQGLNSTPKEWPRRTYQAFSGVAPAGDWQWSLNLASKKGIHTENTGKVYGTLDFSVIWLPQNPNILSFDSLEVWHADTYTETAGEIAEDFIQVQQCVSQLLKQKIEIHRIVQTPRELGDIRVYDSLLWLPEDKGWDVTQQGFGR